MHGYSQEIDHDHNHKHNSQEAGCISYTLGPSHRRSFSPRLTEQKHTSEDSAFSSASDQMVDVKLKRKSARDLYQQYGISQPSGWLSDDEEDSDLVLSGDGSHSPRLRCHVCHVCSHRTSAPSKCTSCGHHFCQECICECREEGVTTSERFSNRETTGKNVKSYTREYQRIVKTEHDTEHDTDHGSKATQVHHRDFTSSNLWRSASRNSAKSETSAHHSTQEKTHATTQAESTAHKNHGANLNKNPFLVADRKAAKKTAPPEESNHTTDGDEEVHTGEQEHTSTHMEDIHGEHQDVHRHHSSGFHGLPHIAEHLEVGTGRTLADLRTDSTEKHRSRQTRTHLKPMTPSVAVAEVSHHEYVEEPVPPEHPNHKPWEESNSPPHNHIHDVRSPPRATPRSHRGRHKLRHVDSGAFKRCASGSESSELRHFARPRTTDSASTQIRTAHHRDDDLCRTLKHAHSPQTVERQTSLSRSGHDQTGHSVRRYESAEF